MEGGCVITFSGEVGPGEPPLPQDHGAEIPMIYVSKGGGGEETTCVMTVFLYTNDAGAWVLECA